MLDPNYQRVPWNAMLFIGHKTWKERPMVPW